MKRRAWLVLGLVVLFAAPLLGRVTLGLPEDFFVFPPLIEWDTPMPGFTPWVFGSFVCIDVLFVALLLLPRRFGFGRAVATTKEETTKSAYPWWGVAGLLLNAASWVVAWTRPGLPLWVEAHTFFPLWLGYILAVDAVTYRRCGTSLVSRSPRAFALLFPASAVSWWYFEFLNRLVRNWWYEGVAPLTGLHYILHATASFSTVLPAVFVTWHLLNTLPWFKQNFQGGPSLKVTRPIAVGGLVAGACLLALLGRFPVETFYLTWLGPLLVLASCLVLGGAEHPCRAWAHGDYRSWAALGVAALICGFFWELWNFWSLPQWHYSVPYVSRYHLFEMPVVGYGGYLPFGPICWCFWLVLAGLGSRNRGAGDPVRPPGV